MKPSCNLKNFIPIAIILCLWLMPFTEVFAVDNVGVFNDIQQKFQTATQAVGSDIQDAATRLYWILLAITIVYTGINVIFRGGDIGGFFGELIKLVLFAGFFLWLLQNGFKMGTDIIASFTQLGSNSIGSNETLNPSGVVGVGFDLWDQTWPGVKDLGIAEKLGAIILLCMSVIICGLIAVNMLLLNITAWLFGFAGLFLLGFGGSRFTSDMAIAYFKSLLNIGLQILTMIMIVGIGKKVVLDAIAGMKDFMFFDFVVICLIMIVIFVLSNKVPQMVGSLAGGAGGGGVTFGAGSVLAAAGTAVAGVTAAAAMMKNASAELAGAAAAMKENYANEKA